MTTPTQTQHPWRASLRTGGAVAVSGLTAAAAAAPLIGDFVTEQWPDTPATTVVVAGVGIVTGASVLVNRILLLPAVNRFLTKIGLGPQPQSEVQAPFGEGEDRFE